MVVLVFLGLVAMCLQFYSALAAGHSLPTHKMAWSVAWYFGLQFAFQIIAFSGINILDQIGFSTGASSTPKSTWTLWRGFTSGCFC